MMKRKEVLDYATKTENIDIPKQLFVDLVKRIYNSVGKCKHCEFYDGGNNVSYCSTWDSQVDKKGYCYQYIKKEKQGD